MGWLRPRPAILMYHRIAEDAFDPWGLAVSQRMFAAQLDWLVRNRTVLPLAEFAILHQAGRLPPRALAITFDDGYACVLEHAAPLLAERGLHATMFLATALLDPDREFWWDDLQRIVLGSRAEQLTVPTRTGTIAMHLGEPDPGDWRWASGAPPATARHHAYKTLWEMLHGMAWHEQADAIAALRNQAGTELSPRLPYRPLTPEQAVGAAGSAITFGAHTAHHADLTACEPAELRTEISDSISGCRKITGEEPECFAYPYGSYDDAAIAAVNEAGFLCACSCEPWSVKASSPAMCLPRLGVGAWDPSMLRHRLAQL